MVQLPPRRSNFRCAAKVLVLLVAVLFLATELEYAPSAASFPSLRSWSTVVSSSPFSHDAPLSASSSPARIQLEQQLLSNLSAGINAKVRDIVAAAVNSSKSTEVDQGIQRALESRYDRKVQEAIVSLQKVLDEKVETYLSSQISKRLDEKLKGLSHGLGPPIRPGAAPEAALTVAMPLVDSAEIASQSPSPTAVAASSASGGNVEQVRRPAQKARPLKATCEGRQLQNIPGDFCSKSKEYNCTTKWEAAYMKDNKDSLRAGLEKIGRPGCFPHGIKVAVLGYFRTGSTLLFNIARLWAALGSGQGLVAGFNCPDPRPSNIGVHGKPQESCSMVCKDHDWKAHMSHMDVVLMSHRDPFYSVCSRKLMDVWCHPTRPSGKVNYTEMEAFKRKCKITPELERPETISQCHTLMGQQAAIYKGRVVQGGQEIGYDVLLEDFFNDPESAIRNIARAIGICEEAATDDGLVELIAEMARRLKSKPDQEMGITRMHDVHHAKQREAKCMHLEEWMRSDDACRAWMESHASYTANVFVQGTNQG